MLSCFWSCATHWHAADKIMTMVRGEKVLSAIVNPQLKKLNIFKK